MARKFKALGLTLFATFVMGAVLASSASATNDVFKSESAPTTLTGEQVEKNKITIAGQAVECTTAKSTATMSAATTSEITGISPTYAGCTYAGGPATITMNGCLWGFGGATDANGHLTTVIVCPTDKHIEITLHAIKCIVTLKAKGATDGNQVAEEGIKVTNDGSGTTRGLILDTTDKVKVTSDPDPDEGIVCATLTNATITFEGTDTLTGEQDPSGSHAGVWVE
jgi:hypothetical protein